MPRTLIFEEQTLPFAFDESMGIYGTMVEPPVYMLEVGEIYTVAWDGKEYICLCDTINLNNMNWEAIGNRAAIGGEDTGEPFAIASISSDGVPYYNIIAAADTEASHTIAIYHGAEEKESAIVLKDRNGNPVQYEGAKAINLLMQDGKEQIFIPGEAQTKSVAANFATGNMKVVPDTGKLLTEVTVQKPETLLPANIVNNVNIAGVVGTAEVPESVQKTIDTDAIGFAGGNIVVAPQDGKVFSKVTVQKPANLIPDYIAEGVNIAGIVGTLVAGGSDVKVTALYMIGNNISTSKTVPHNLGVVPDLFIMFVQNSTAYTMTGSSSSYKGKLFAGWYVSDALAAKYPNMLVGYNARISASASNGELQCTPAFVTEITATTAKFVGNPIVAAGYNVIAIGGLI